jgi:hypothetical protein
MRTKYTNNSNNNTGENENNKTYISVTEGIY